MDGTLGSASILFAELGNVCGVAVDPAAGKIYWANFSTNAIRVGNLNGTGTPLTLFTDPGGSAPSGVAIDPRTTRSTGRTSSPTKIRAGNLDGSGFAQSLFSGEDNPIGVAADPAAGKIYWTDLNAGTVRVGPLGGSIVGAAQTLFNSSTPSGPAIDPTTNKIYWTSWTSGLGIRVGNRDGTGTVSTLFGGEGASLFAALVKAPVNTGRPAISGGAKVGKELTCQNGTWAPDLLASFLFRAPASFAYRWKLNGEHRHRSDVHAQSGRRLHMHGDGHQPGRRYCADQRGKEGQGPLGSGYLGTGGVPLGGRRARTPMPPAMDDRGVRRGILGLPYQRRP